MNPRSAMVGLLLAALGAAGPAIAEPADCPPAAVVEGDPAEVEPVRQHLASAGLVAAPADCPAVRARVTRHGDELAVVLLDPAGRSAGRRLADARIAATWIESWMSPDLGAPLLAPRRAAAWRAAPRADAVVAAPAGSPEPLVSLGVASRSLDGGDGSSWRSLDASACARLGFACIGVAGQVAENSGFSINGGYTQAKRRTVDLLATGRIPVRLGRATLAPGAAIGIGWLRTERDEPAEPVLETDPGCMEPDPNNGACPPVDVPPIWIGDGFSVLTLGLRAQLGATLSVPVAGPLALEVGAGIDLVPGAHREPFSVMQPAPDGQDPADDQPISDPVMDLPGEPDHFTWWSIGLRVGAW